MKDASNGGVACQGVGGAYKATIIANTEAKGTDDASIAEGMKDIMDAITKCPQSTLVLAGYRYVIILPRLSEPR
jgi:cutinase